MKSNWVSRVFGHYEIYYFYTLPDSNYGPIVTNFDWRKEENYPYYFLALFNGKEYIAFTDVNWPTLEEAKAEIEGVYHGR